MVDPDDQLVLLHSKNKKREDLISQRSFFFALLFFWLALIKVKAELSLSKHLLFIGNYWCFRAYRVRGGALVFFVLWSKLYCGATCFEVGNPRYKLFGTDLPNALLNNAEITCPNGPGFVPFCFYEILSFCWNCLRYCIDMTRWRFPIGKKVSK